SPPDTPPLPATSHRPPPPKARSAPRASHAGIPDISPANPHKPLSYRPCSRHQQSESRIADPAVPHLSAAPGTANSPPRSAPAPPPITPHHPEYSALIQISAELKEMPICNSRSPMRMAPSFILSARRTCCRKRLLQWTHSEATANWQSLLEVGRHRRID